MGNRAILVTLLPGALQKHLFNHGDKETAENIRAGRHHAGIPTKTGFCIP